MSILDRIPEFPPLLRQVPESKGTPLGLFAISDFFGLSKAGTNVTAKTALSLPAFYSAVRLISETIASLPLQVFEVKDGQKTLRRDHPIYKLIKDKPNPNMTSFIWRELVATEVMLHGNHVSLISERVNEVPTRLTPFPPRDIMINVINGKVWYTLRTTEGDITVDSSNVVHVKALGDNGITGKSIIQVARENLGLGLAEQETAANFYGSGMKLDYQITNAGELSEEGLKRLRETISKYTGAGGERTFLPLDAGMEAKPLGVPPQDAQFLESRKFSVTDIARWLRVPPPLIYDLERATFSNISELILSFVKFSLTPWLVNIETELNDKLFMESEKGSFFSEFNVDGLLRGDSKARAESHKIALQNGWLSINEVRAMENLNPILGGDQHFFAMNFQPINSAGAEENERVAAGVRKLLESKNGEVPTDLREEIEELYN